MFQFRRFPACTYFIQYTLTEYCSAGFPHSEISGSTAICASPKLIAACRVLHRLLMPRHSPCALSSLTYFLVNKKVGKENFYSVLSPHLAHKNLLLSQPACAGLWKRFRFCLVLKFKNYAGFQSYWTKLFVLPYLKFHICFCFPLLLALNTLVSLFSFQGAASGL